MIDPEDLDRYLLMLREASKENESFGVPFTQRICGLGRKEAAQVLIQALEARQIVRDAMRPWQYRFI